MFSGQLEVGGSVRINGNRGRLGDERCGERGEGLLDRYMAERRRRIRRAGRKVASGKIIDAAMDAMQLFSFGSSVADAAKAMGLVGTEADKHLVAGVVNGLMCGPFGKLAAIGDAEDVLQAQLPHLRQQLKRAQKVAGKPCKLAGTCAPGQWVPSPSQRLGAKQPSRGYPKSGKAGAAASKLVLSPARCERLLDLMRHGILGSFRRALPGLRLSLKAEMRLGGPNPGRATSAGSSLASSFLDDPSLSFEDKLFYFLAMVARGQEQKMEKLMRKYDKAQQRRKQKAKTDQALGMGGSLATVGLTAALTAAGLPPPFSSMVAQMVSSGAIELGKSAAEGVEELGDALKSSRGAAGDTALSKDQKEWSEQRWMLELQRAQEKLTKLYNIMSNITKASHDTQMNAIRNMR